MFSSEGSRELRGEGRDRNLINKVPPPEAAAWNYLIGVTNDAGNGGI
jgi:hypothetical protein